MDGQVGNAKLLDLVGREIRRLPKHWSGPAHSVAFSPHGRATLCEDYGGLALSNVVTGEIIQRLSDREGTDREYDHRFVTVAFSADGLFVLSGSEYGQLELWDVSAWTRPKAAAN
jgi:WD40 repeat protein